MAIDSPIDKIQAFSMDLDLLKRKAKVQWDGIKKEINPRQFCNLIDIDVQVYEHQKDVCGDIFDDKQLETQSKCDVDKLDEKACNKLIRKTKSKDRKCTNFYGRKLLQNLPIGINDYEPSGTLLLHQLCQDDHLIDDNSKAVEHKINKMFQRDENIFKWT